MGVAKNISTLPPKITSYKPSIKKPTEKTTINNKITRNMNKQTYNGENQKKTKPKPKESHQIKEKMTK